VSIDAELLDVVAELGPDERRVLLALARRLLVQQEAYGRLDHRARRAQLAEGAR
jgi:hypothetical protein